METKKTQEQSEEAINRKLSSPFLIKMTSGEHNKHCDIYNHGSYHTVRECAEGYKWVDGRVDVIPSGYNFKVVNEKPETKICPNCENEFDIEWPFINYDDKEICIRCYERYNFVHRDSYREALRKELLLEMLENKDVIGDEQICFCSTKKEVQTRYVCKNDKCGASWE